MKIHIQKHRLSNLYSFISNLSQWNELACVPQRKKEWIKLTGKLAEDEKFALKKFSRIFQKSEESIELLFLFKSESVWKILPRKIGKEKTEDLKQIFKLFEKRFGIVWATNSKKIDTFKKYFIKNKKDIDEKVKVIKNLAGVKNIKEAVNLHFLLSSSSHDDCQGWAYEKNIMLECSGWPLNKIDFLLNNIFLHEAFHIFFKKNKSNFELFNRMIRENSSILLKNSLINWPPEIVFEEALVGSFLPDGYLAEKFSGKDIGKITEKEYKNKDDLANLRNYCALSLYENAKDYVDNNKAIDKTYLQNVFSTVSNFLKEKSRS